MPKNAPRVALKEGVIAENIISSRWRMGSSLVRIMRIPL